MEVLIDQDGFLHFKRGGVWKKQTCKYFALHLKYCGDHCPSFEDPITSNGTISLFTCYTMTRTSEKDFTDARVK